MIRRRKLSTSLGMKSGRHVDVYVAASLTNRRDRPATALNHLQLSQQYRPLEIADTHNVPDVHSQWRSHHTQQILRLFYPTLYSNETNSLASTVTASNYQEYKAEIINQVSNR